MKKAELRVVEALRDCFALFHPTSTPTCLQAVRVVPANLWREIWWSPHGRISLTRQHGISKNVSSSQHLEKTSPIICVVKKTWKCRNVFKSADFLLYKCCPFPLELPICIPCLSHSPFNHLGNSKVTCEFQGEVEAWSSEIYQISIQTSQIPSNLHRMEMPLWISSKSPSFTVHWFKSPWRQVVGVWRWPDHIFFPSWT